MAQFSHQVLLQDTTLNYLLNSKFSVCSLSLVLSPNSLISDSKGTRPPRLVCSLFCCHCTYRLACTKEVPVEPGNRGAITPSNFRFKCILKPVLSKVRERLVFLNVFSTLFADMVNLTILKISAIFVGKRNTKVSVHCRVRTKKFIYIKVRKPLRLALKCTFFGQHRLII